MAGIMWQPIAEKTVTTAGTQIQISTSEVPTAGLQIQAAEGNTGLIYVGLSDVSNVLYLVALGAGEVWSTSNAGDDRSREFYLSDYWLDCSVNGEKAYTSYLKAR